MSRNPDIVTATELADFVFCPESFRLSALGHESANQPARDSGTAYHADKAAAETVAGGSIAIGRLLIVLALLMLAAWWMG